MMRFVLGFTSALLLMLIAWVAISFQWFKEPIPLNGEQFRQMWEDTARDSAGRWMLVEAKDASYFLVLEYPTKRYKIRVGATEIQVRKQYATLPITLQSGEVALTSDLDHPLTR